MSFIRLAVRAWLRGLKRVRHAIQRIKPGHHVDRSIRRVVKRLHEGAKATAAGARRRATTALVRGRQAVYYRVPGERSTCPACGGRGIRHIEPLSYSRPIAYRWRFGFVSGCRTCGLLFANPLPSDEHLAGVYSPDGDWGRSRQDEEEAQVSPSRLERVFEPIATHLSVLRPPAGAAVLDFGCGLGGLLDTLAAAGWTTYGLDPATKVAFRRHREVTSLPTVPTFDLVVLHHVLEHVKAPLAILHALAPAVRVGGFVLISVPNLDGVADHGDLQYCLRSKTHVMAYSARCLEWLLAAAGFELVSADATSVSPRGRQMAVIGRRVVTTMTRPPEPLGGALHALARYRTGRPGVWQRVPVRIQAALLNAARAPRAD